MREYGEVGCGTAFIIACVLAVFALFAAVGTGLLPVQLWWQRVSVEQSKSYVDSMNLQMEQAIQEYARLDTKIVETSNADAKDVYKGQQKQIVFGICSTLAKMQAGTPSTRVLSFVNSHGGCP